MVETVGQLISELQELDPELPLAISSDEEGNNIRVFHGVGEEEVTELRYNYMDIICPEDVEEYESLEDYKEDHGLPEEWQPVKIAVLW